MIFKIPISVSSEFQYSSELELLKRRRQYTINTRSIIHYIYGLYKR